jgi:glutathione S-transferase
MALKLYFAPGACSFVPHTMLEVAGAAYEPVLVKLHKGEQNTPEFLALNPRGQVPVLIDGDVVITQIVAIVSYINDVVANGQFLPQDPVAKAKVLERLAWFNNTVHTTFTHFFMPQKFSSEATHHAAMQQFNVGKYREQLQEIDTLCAKAAPWLAGEHIGPLDAYALTLMRWGGFAGIDAKSWPHLWPHANKVAQHPAVARVVARERLVLDVAPL